VSPTSAYLDHASGGPVDARVRAAMRPFWEEDMPGPDALHEGARRPAEALATAHAQVAGLVGAEPESVIFTASATEARNLAVKGLLGANRALGTHVVASRVEHPATLAACRSAARAGAELTLVEVDGEGRLDPDALAAAVREDTALVCLVHGQPDIGTLQDVPALVAAVRERRPEARVHVDATATAGLLPLDVAVLGADALTLSARPMGGPLWVGALWVRPGARLHPLIEGGLQEGGKRAGAEALPAVVGMGAAAALAAEEMAGRAERLRALDARLRAGLLAVTDVRLNGPPEGRVPGLVNVSAGWVEGESLALALDALGVAVAPGSACTAHAGKAAPVLEAIGLAPPWTHSSVLFTLGLATRADEIDHAIAAFAEAVARLRAMSPLAPAGG
jgi:cysteine desulfurase